MRREVCDEMGMGRGGDPRTPTLPGDSRRLSLQGGQCWVPRLATPLGMPARPAQEPGKGSVLGAEPQDRSKGAAVSGGKARRSPRQWRWLEAGEGAGPGPRPSWSGRSVTYLTLSSRFLSAFPQAAASLRSCWAARTRRPLLAASSCARAHSRTCASRPSWISMCHMAFLAKERRFMSKNGLATRATPPRSVHPRELGGPGHRVQTNTLGGHGTPWWVSSSSSEPCGPTAGDTEAATSRSAPLSLPPSHQAQPGWELGLHVLSCHWPAPGPAGRRAVCYPETCRGHRWGVLPLRGAPCRLGMAGGRAGEQGAGRDHGGSGQGVSGMDGQQEANVWFQRRQRQGDARVSSLCCTQPWALTTSLHRQTPGLQGKMARSISRAGDSSKKTGTRPKDSRTCLRKVPLAWSSKVGADGKDPSPLQDRSLSPADHKQNKTHAERRERKARGNWKSPCGHRCHN